MSEQTEKLYTIQTGGERWRQKAKSIREAVRKAWQRRPPKSVGVLVQFNARGMDTSFSLAHVALHMAGFDVEEPTLEEYLARVEAGEAGMSGRK